MRWLDTNDWDALRKLADSGEDFIFSLKDDDKYIHADSANDGEY